jgi:CxxC-x17-CxxC domain-containing protein
MSEKKKRDRSINAEISLKNAPKRLKSGVSPKKAHGTQVSFNVKCARCGDTDTLTFVPRTQADLLCKACAKQVFGEDWASGRETEFTTVFEFHCDQCGRFSEVPFQPETDEPLLCAPCYRGEYYSNTERLKGRKIMK